MKTALELITEERQRQIAKGYTASHDDDLIGGELAAGGGCFALYAGWQSPGCDVEDLAKEKRSIAGSDWPFERASFRPDENPIANLAKAGAMIVAEIERLQRQIAPNQPEGK